jgi:hypothetical protein
MSPLRDPLGFDGSPAEAAASSCFDACCRLGALVELATEQAISTGSGLD